MHKPLISVLMPAFNSEEYIAESIESILSSNYLNYEFIIVDDGSTDATNEIIKKYLKKYENIFLHNKLNSGIVDSLNYGLKFCKGKWVARLDSDDLSSPDRLGKQLKIAESINNVGLVGSDYIRIDKFGNELYSYGFPTSNHKLNERLIKCKAFFPHSSAFFNKELVDFLGGYRNRVSHSEDWDLWIRISQYKKIVSVNSKLLKIRDQEKQITKFNYGKNQIYDARLALISHWYRINKNFDPISIFNNNEYRVFQSYIYQSLEKRNFDTYLRLFNIQKSPLFKRFIIPFILFRYIFKPKIIIDLFMIVFFSDIINDKISRSYFDIYIKKKC